MVKSLSLLKNIIYCILIGIFSGCFAWLFVAIYKFGVTHIWHFLTKTDPTFFFLPLIICLIGGVVVGLCQKYIGTYPVLLDDILKDYKVTKHIEYRTLHKTFICSLVTLIFGGCVGPEASLSGILGGISSFTKDILSRKNRGVENLLVKKLLYITVFIFGLISFSILLKNDNVLVVSANLGAFYLRKKELLMMLPLVIFGIIISLFYEAVIRFLVKILAPLENKKIIRALIGGFFLGLSSCFIIYILFSGEHKLDVLSAQWQTMGAVYLFTLGIAKLVISQLCIHTGWRGGNIFPIIFSGICFGYAFALILGINPLISIIVVTSAMLGGIMRQPIIAVLLMFLIIPFNVSIFSFVMMILIMAIAATISSFAQKVIINRFDKLNSIVV